LTIDNALQFQGYAYFDYIHAGGYANWTDFLGEQWTGVAHTDAQNQVDISMKNFDLILKN
jgi:hypothetical protein